MISFFVWIASIVWMKYIYQKRWNDDDCVVLLPMTMLMMMLNMEGRLVAMIEQQDDSCFAVCASFFLCLSSLSL